LHKLNSMTELIHGDCLEVLRSMPDCSVDAVVTDPPYGLSFMGKKWDYDVPSVEVWAECLRVLKPGGHLLAFAGTRTQHRMAVRIEDAGFEIRDMIAWVYGSGFPKSLDVSKAIDKAAGAERKVVGTKKHHAGNIHNARYGQATATEYIYSDPATPEAKQWEGWGTALKPALEPITVARKPLIGTVAENVLQHGTGAINVDGCRVGTEERTTNWSGTANYKVSDPKIGTTTALGRWPANFIHDGSEEVVGLFPDTKSGKMGPWNNRTTNGSPNGIYGKFDEEHPLSETYGDSGSAARFFYCAKASKRDRDEGCEGMEQRKAGAMSGIETREGKPTNHPMRTNFHPTVKPTDLMRYLCRLVTPPDGIVLDPFMGSGSTGKAAALEGFSFIGIEREAEYVAIAQARIKHAQQ
jgi:site-specific DNA-methyltransferase (adenine-specific)